MYKQVIILQGRKVVEPSKAKSGVQAECLCKDMIRPHFKDGITMGCPPMGYAMRAIGFRVGF
jgi:hypothetical protein